MRAAGVMFRAMRLFALILAFVTATAAVAQDDSAALRDLVSAYEQAVRSGDVPKSGIRQRLADNFTATLPGGQVIRSYGELSKNENALRTMVGRAAVYDTVNVSVDAAATHVSGDLAAIAGQTENHATAQAGKSRRFTTHWTAVARREGGVWKLARHQAVMDPANNPWFAEEGGGGPGWLVVAVVGVLLGLAGLVAGFVLAKMTGGAKAPAPAAPALRAPTGRSWDKGASAPPADAATPPAAPSGRSWDKPAAPAAASAETPEPAAEAAPAPPPADSPRPKRAWEK